MQRTIERFGLVPLVNFGQVAPNLYRCAQPQYQYQYDWLDKTLKAETVVNIRMESRHDDRMLKCRVPVVNFDVPDQKTPTFAQAIKWQKLVWENHEKPMIFHCLHGHGRTSTFSVLAKMTMGMTLEQAMQDEMKRFHFSFRHPAQAAWLEEFAAIQAKGAHNESNT